MSKLLAKLRNHQNFSNSELEIAKFICANPHKVIKMSIRDIAKETYTSPTTVLRLCRKICDNGFPEFRIELAKELQSYQSDINFSSSKEAMAKKMENIDQVMHELKISVIKSIEFTQQLISPDIMQNIIQLINNASVIDIYGRGSSNNVGEDFRYKLYRLGYQVQLFKGIDSQAIQAFNSNKDHCAIIISSSGETPEIINFAEILNNRETPIISITGSQDCTLIQHSDYPLFFKCFESNQRVGSITSRSAMQYILDTIYFAILNDDYEKHSKTIVNNYVPIDIATKK